MNKKLLSGLLIFFLLLLLSLCVMLSDRDGYAISIERRLAAPSAEYPFGCDTLGRDLLARTAEGALISAFVGASVMFSALLTGLLIGGLSVEFPPLDGPLMRLCDCFKAFPSVLFASFLVIVMDNGIFSIIFALSIVFIPQVARLVRSQMLLLQAEPFIKAKTMVGLRRYRIILGEIANHLLPSLLIQAAFIYASSVIAETSLSFIGAGVAMPIPTIGNILSEGRSVITTAWWMILFPSLAILISVLSLNLISDGLKELKGERDVYR